MRVSLVTRIVVGYLVVLLLMGGVVAYGLASMQRMGDQVGVVRRGVLPVSARFQRLTRELNRTALTLSQGGMRDILWLSYYLPDMHPFDDLAQVGEAVEALSLELLLPEQTRETFASVAQDAARIVHSRSLLEQRRMPPEIELRTAQARSNRELYEMLAGMFVERVREKGRHEISAETVRRELAEVTESLRKEVLSLEAAYNLGTTALWGGTSQQEEKALTVSMVLMATTLAVIIAVLVLLLIWLRPLRQLGTYAQRVSLGEYDHPLPLHSGDEIGVLAEELKVMANRLKEREEMIRRQAQELVRADRFSTIGKMATQIAHELRNPLNALGLKLELFEDSVDEAQEALGPQSHEELRKLIRTTGKEIDRLRDITDYYLKFARFPDVEREWVDLSPMVNELLNLYAEEAVQAGVEVEREVEAPLKGHADPNLLRHALTNLLKNALEAMKQRGGKVLVRAWRDRDQVRMVIKDNGAGIPPEDLDRIFEPFFSSKRSGTGLGLTLVQQIVSEHGGEVTCTSQQGEGTVFRISLPD